MPTPKRPTNEEHIHCDVCMREIPASDAKNAEIQDYVMHFCGLECYDKWQKNAPAAQKAPEANK